MLLHAILLIKPTNGCPVNLFKKNDKDCRPLYPLIIVYQYLNLITELV